MTAAATAELPPRLYEAIYILRPDVTKEAAEKVAARVEEVIGREDGKLTLVENWGRRQLAYTIQHKRRGVYMYINYLGTGELVAELERNFRMLDEVMRFQTVKLDDAPESAEVDSTQVKFESIEPVEDEDEDWTLEQELGLVPAPHRKSDSSDGDSEDDDPRRPFRKDEEEEEEE